MHAGQIMTGCSTENDQAWDRERLGMRRMVQRREYWCGSTSICKPYVLLCLSLSYVLVTVINGSGGLAAKLSCGWPSHKGICG